MRKALAVLAILAAMPLLAMAQSTFSAVDANVNFGFYAGGKMMPAGSYEFKVIEQGGTLSVLNEKTDQTFFVPILTTISPRESSDADVVFDKTGSTYYLSEVYIPGLDGYLVQGAPAKHVHVMIKAEK